MNLIRHNLRWVVAGLLFLVTVINYMDRQTLSVLAPVIMKEFGWTNQQYGYVTGAFLIFYVLGQATGGAAIDKLGTRTGFASILTWWSLATIGHRFAGGIWSFGFWRAMLGIGEAGNWPGAIKCISEWFPQKERAFAAAVFNLGSSTGAITPPLIVWMYAHYGWRNVFVLSGAIGFIWLAMWLVFYRVPREHPWITPEELRHIETGQESTVAGGAVAHLPWASLLGYRQVWGILLARFLSEPVWWFYLFWLPPYLMNKRGLSISQMGWAAALPYVTSGLGCLVGGGMSSLLIRWGWSVNKARKTVIVASAFLMPCALFVYSAQSNWTAVALISLATFAHQSFSTNVLVLPADLFPSRVVASVTGLGGLGIAASAMTQFGVGYVVDHFSYAPLFTAAGLLHPLAAIAMLLLVGKIQVAEVRA